MNNTLIKFGYPDTIIKSYDHWSVLLRPQQVTLGSLILGAHSNAESFGELSTQTMAELSTVIKNIEQTLSNCFDYDKLNYLMLMMVDPHVHFHVLPRYSNYREFRTLKAEDSAWPGPPDLTRTLEIDEIRMQELLEYLRDKWTA